MSPFNRPQERPGDTRVLDCLYRVGAFVNATEDPREALDFILAEIVHTLNASSASIALLEPTTGSLRIEVSNGLDDGSVQQVMAQGQGITGWVALHARPLLVPDVSKDPRYVELRQGIRQVALQCLARCIAWDHINEANRGWHLEASKLSFAVS